MDEGDGVGHGLPGHGQRAVLPKLRLDAVVAGSLGEAPHRGLLGLVLGLQPRAAAQHAHAQLVEQRLPQGGGAQDQRRLELAGCGVKACVEDPGVRAARAQREPVLRLEQHRLHAMAREGVCDGAAHHPTPDDRDACVCDGHDRRRLYVYLRRSALARCP
jgi:hypothetical protein